MCGCQQASPSQMELQNLTLWAMRERERENMMVIPPRVIQRALVLVAGPLPPAPPQGTFRNAWGCFLLYDGSATCFQWVGATTGQTHTAKNCPPQCTAPPPTKQPSPRDRALPNHSPHQLQSCFPSWSQNPVFQDAGLSCSLGPTRTAAPVSGHR